MSAANGGEHDSLAPVIPLFGGPSPSPTDPGRWHTSWLGDDAQQDGADAAEQGPERDTGRGSASTRGAIGGDAGPAKSAGVGAAGLTERERAERTLLKKLRTRSLSVREARGVLGGFDLGGAAVDDVIDTFERNGYLDDAKLAEQLVYSGTQRKGQGRQVVSRTLSERGIPRDIVDAALAELPDDDAERALDFARTKARSMSRLAPDVALRRLAGQLARRGYGSTSLSAARQALDELDD